MISKLALARVLALAPAGCGWLPADAPPQRPVADPDAALVHAWRVDAHLLGARTPLTEADAAAHHGRAVSVPRTGYTTPWHGTCEESGRTRRERPLAEVAAELQLERASVQRHGFTDPLAEYRLVCMDPGRPAPTLTLYIAGEHALTCFSGACYVLGH